MSSGQAPGLTARDDDVVEIASRAHRLGFCPWRVATALAASGTAVTHLEEQLGRRKRRSGIAAHDVAA